MEASNVIKECNTYKQPVFGLRKPKATSIEAFTLAKETISANSSPFKAKYNSFGKLDQHFTVTLSLLNSPQKQPFLRLIAHQLAQSQRL